VGNVFFPCLLLGNLSSPSPDLPIFLFSIILAGHFLGLLEDPERSYQNLRSRIVHIIIFAAAGITIKLNFIFFASSVVFISLLFTAKTDKTIFSEKSFQLKLILCSATFLIVWMVRGVILSGYIAYPFPWVSFPVEWKIPFASVVNMANWIAAWNRLPGVRHWDQVLNNWNWLEPWLTNLFADPFAILIPLILATIGLSIFLAMYRYRKRQAQHRFLLLFLIPPVFSIICWFFTAPAPRFASPFFWLLGLGALAISCGNPSAKSAKILIMVPFVFLLNFFIPFSNVKEAAHIAVTQKSLPKALSYLNRKTEMILMTDKAFLFYYPPRVPVVIYKTDWGLDLFTLKKGDQSWDPPLPFTLYPHPKLRLRGTSLQDGFMIDPPDPGDPSVGMHEERITKKWILTVP